MTPYIGEIKMVAIGSSNTPNGWAYCNGQLITISSNTALFSLLGTNFGGNGQINFGLPDLRSRTPIGQGQGAGLSYRPLGEFGGDETSSLTTNNLPSHNHTINSLSASYPANSNLGTTDNPTNNYPAALEEGYAYRNAANAVGGGVAQNIPINGNLSSSGSGTPHNNIMPYQTIRYLIALSGIFPSSGGGGSPTDGTYMGEIRYFPYNFTPGGWADCDGSLLEIADHPALFSLLSTTYGGNGSTNFALPDLRGRTPLGRSGTDSLGAMGGSETVALAINNLPSHNHNGVFNIQYAPSASSNAANQAGAAGNVPAQGRVNGSNPYASTANTNMGNLAATSNLIVSNSGSNQAHNNMQPYLVLRPCIALSGLYPSFS